MSRAPERFQKFEFDTRMLSTSPRFRGELKCRSVSTESAMLVSNTFLSLIPCCQRAPQSPWQQWRILGWWDSKSTFNERGPACLRMRGLWYVANTKQTGELPRRSTQTCTRSTVAALYRLTPREPSRSMEIERPESTSRASHSLRMANSQSSRELTRAGPYSRSWMVATPPSERRHSRAYGEGVGSEPAARLAAPGISSSCSAWTNLLSRPGARGLSGPNRPETARHASSTIPKSLSEGNAYAVEGSSGTKVS